MMTRSLLRYNQVSKLSLPGSKFWCPTSCKFALPFDGSTSDSGDQLGSFMATRLGLSICFFLPFANWMFFVFLKTTQWFCPSIMHPTKWGELLKIWSTLPTVFLGPYAHFYMMGLYMMGHNGKRFQTAYLSQPISAQNGISVTKPSESWFAALPPWQVWKHDAYWHQEPKWEPWLSIPVLS